MVVPGGKLLVDSLEFDRRVCFFCLNISTVCSFWMLRTMQTKNIYFLLCSRNWIGVPLTNVDEAVFDVSFELQLQGFGQRGVTDAGVMLERCRNHTSKAVAFRTTRLFESDLGLGCCWVCSGALIVVTCLSAFKRLQENSLRLSWGPLRVVRISIKVETLILSEWPLASNRICRHEKWSKWC